MEELRKLGLLDRAGKPLAARIQRVLGRLLPRFRRQFPTIQDEVSQIEILEEAGRRIAAREERSGPLEKINGYAWVTIRSVATSRLRKASSRLEQRTLGPKASHAVLSTVRTQSGTPEQIERDILLREALELLSPEERRVCMWKLAGYSSEEIGRHRGSSAAAVDTLFFRAKQKMCTALGVQRSGEANDRAEPPSPDSEPSKPR